MSENTIKIFTDGACKGNPGLGGWGALIIENGKEKEIYGGSFNKSLMVTLNFLAMDHILSPSFT